MSSPAIYYIPTTPPTPLLPFGHREMSSCSLDSVPASLVATRAAAAIHGGGGAEGGRAEGGVPSHPLHGETPSTTPRPPPYPPRHSLWFPRCLGRSASPVGWRVCLLAAGGCHQNRGGAGRHDGTLAAPTPPPHPPDHARHCILFSLSFLFCFSLCLFCLRILFLFSVPRSAGAALA